MSKLGRREKIKLSIRKRVSGSTERPRLSVFRSNTHIYAQIINDETGLILASASSKTLAVADGTPLETATVVGKALAQTAIAANISKVVFDRNGYLYHGRVKALAEAAREGGLNF
jgi:large subunit ribosomal protein L18